MEQKESSGVIRGHGRECEDESETMDISTQSGYEVHISQLEIKVAVVLVPNEEGRGQDVGRGGIVNMSSDKHH